MMCVPGDKVWPAYFPERRATCARTLPLYARATCCTRRKTSIAREIDGGLVKVPHDWIRRGSGYRAIPYVPTKVNGVRSGQRAFSLNSLMTAVATSEIGLAEK